MDLRRDRVVDFGGVGWRVLMHSARFFCAFFTPDGPFLFVKRASTGRCARFEEPMRASCHVASASGRA
jgi:hypothetical protein